MLIFLSLSSLFSQNQKEDKYFTHSPLKASLFSTVLPGLGQAYNKKYWKIPVIYGSIGILGYLFYENKKNYILYRDVYLGRISDDPNNTDQFIGIYTTDNLKIIKDYYRKNLELNIIMALAVYVLSIIDASVDAHLMEFDVSDDLSINLSPAIQHFPAYDKTYKGLSLTLKF